MSATESVAGRDVRADVREGDTWTRAQAVKNGALYALIRATLFLVAPLPARALRMLGRALGAIALLTFGHARRTAHANVARIFPDRSPAERRALVRRCYAALGAHLGDAVALLRGDALDLLPIDDASLSLLEDARREGAGVLFASAHLGPWERVAATLVARGVPLTTIARSSYDPRLDALYDRLRGGGGVGVIYRGRDGAASRIVRTLRAGGVLGAPMDLRSRVPSIDVPFLGVVAPTAVGPARIALRTGAAVVVGTVAPASDLPHLSDTAPYRITCTRIPTRDLMTDGDGKPSDDAERILTARINAELSRRVLALPAEWPLMHERFPRVLS
jgi:KDO2-lipid IV(A) lauroyltransferase